MKGKSKKIIISIIMVLTIIGVFFLGYFSRDIFLDKELKETYDFLQTYKDYYYYDSEGSLVKEISEAILDKYSKYYTKEEYERENAESYGNTSGIGLSFYVDNLTIFRVAGNSPSKNAGVKSGGVLKEIDIGNGYEALTDYNSFESKYSLVKTGQELGLKIDYNGNLKEYRFKRSEYKRTFVEYMDSLGCYTFTDKDGEMKLFKTDDERVILNDSIGYIRYESFNGRDDGLTGSSGQIEEVLKKFKNDKKKNLIFDLRGNGGGYLEILCDIAPHFIDGNASKNNLVAYSIDKNGKRENYYCKGSLFSSYNFENIVILADENSASASEAFIGAVLDYDKTNIVKVLVSSSIENGEKVYKTYGKGIMQNTFKHLDGSAVKLTVAEIFWPLSKTCIHQKGLVGGDSGKVLKVESENSLSYAIELCD